jgi:hypothetical protein
MLDLELVGHGSGSDGDGIGISDSVVRREGK